MTERSWYARLVRRVFCGNVPEGVELPRWVRWFLPRPVGMPGPSCPLCGGPTHTLFERDAIRCRWCRSTIDCDERPVVGK